MTEKCIRNCCIEKSTEMELHVRALLLCFIFGFAIKHAKTDEFPTQELLDLLRPVAKKCQLMTTVASDTIENFSKGTMPDDPKLKCYMKCIFLEFEVLDVDTGTFHYEKMLEFVPESMKKIAYRMGKDCVHFKGEEGDDLCQVSYDLHKCWQQSDPEHYFLI